MLSKTCSDRFTVTVTVVLGDKSSPAKLNLELKSAGTQLNSFLQQGDRGLQSTGRWSPFLVVSSDSFSSSNSEHEYCTCVTEERRRQHWGADTKLIFNLSRRSPSITQLIPKPLIEPHHCASIFQFSSTLFTAGQQLLGTYIKSCYYCSTKLLSYHMNEVYSTLGAIMDWNGHIFQTLPSLFFFILISQIPAQKDEQPAAFFFPFARIYFASCSNLLSPSISDHFLFSSRAQKHYFTIIIPPEVPPAIRQTAPCALY